MGLRSVTPVASLQPAEIDRWTRCTAHAHPGLPGTLDADMQESDSENEVTRPKPQVLPGAVPQRDCRGSGLTPLQQPCLRWGTPRKVPVALIVCPCVSNLILRIQTRWPDVLSWDFAFQPLKETQQVCTAYVWAYGSIYLRTSSQCPQWRHGLLLTG